MIFLRFAAMPFADSTLIFSEERGSLSSLPIPRYNIEETVPQSFIQLHGPSAFGRQDLREDRDASLFSLLLTACYRGHAASRREGQEEKSILY